MEDKIANALNMVPLNETKSELVEVSNTELVHYEEVVDQAAEEAHEDYIQVRENLKNLISVSQEVFENVKDVAIVTQDNKAFDSFSKMLDSMVKANKELIGIHKDMFGIKPSIIEEPKTQQADTINNIIFTGSADELFGRLKDMGAISSKKLNNDD